MRLAFAPAEVGEAEEDRCVGRGAELGAEVALAAGIVELAIGVWALGYPGRSAWLLVLWVGIGALMRGITEIVLAFKLRSARIAVG